MYVPGRISALASQSTAADGRSTNGSPFPGGARQCVDDSVPVRVTVSFFTCWKQKNHMKTHVHTRSENILNTCDLSCLAFLSVVVSARAAVEARGVGSRDRAGGRGGAADTGRGNAGRGGGARGSAGGLREVETDLVARSRVGRAE